MRLSSLPVQGDEVAGRAIIFLRKSHDLCKRTVSRLFPRRFSRASIVPANSLALSIMISSPTVSIVMGKSIGAGFPLGGFMAKAEIMDCLPAPAHLFTLGGNATACAAGVAAFDYLQSDEFQKILADNTKLLEECVADLRATFPDVITGRRGIDMSCALVVTKKDENGNDVPDGDGTFKILYRAYERGLLIISLSENILRVQPPLNIRPENLKRALQF